MEPRLAVIFLLAPFVLVFLYAAWHERARFKREGPSSYGLTYDPETNTTHVGALPDEEDSYDPDAFDPNDTPEQGETEDTSETSPDDDQKQDKTT